MARTAILVVLLLAVSYSYAFIPGMGMTGMNPLSSMMMMKAMGGGQTSNMMKMMGLMNLMKPQSTTTGGKGAATSAAATNPMLNGMIAMGLCEKTENNQSPFCTPELCKMKGTITLGRPTAFQCVIGFGCCYKDHMSMMMGKLLN